jgi:uncharacterized membrane protein
MSFPRRPTSAQALASFLAVAGVTHFAAPKFYDAIVPHVLPNPRAWTYLSGVAELATAAAVAHRGTRRAGGAVAAVLFLAVFPANIQFAIDAHTASERAIAYGRLPLQAPMIVWALRVRHAAPD